MVRNRLESNLSTLMGQTMAHGIISRAVPYQDRTPFGARVSAITIETRLEDHHWQLTGISAELDSLRRYHRQILQELPTAVSIIGAEGEVLSWNHAMEQLTGITAETIIGSTLASLPDEWHELMTSFAFGDEIDESRRELSRSDGEDHLLLNLHKASISALGEVVIVIDDMTDEHRLEQQLLHRERLASIGQLAAGVAHEVGNPITGVACLAQNLKIETEQPELIELADQILEQTNRVSAILQSLVNFSRSGGDGLGSRLVFRSTCANAPTRRSNCFHSARTIAVSTSSTSVRTI
ncbi:MAG: PAS domain S-box protein [Gammaproteobacteria bacterium]|nr:PAS domain S-box protein [Gammaproteobacteria bacterium]